MVLDGHLIGRAGETEVVKESRFLSLPCKIRQKLQYEFDGVDLIRHIADVLTPAYGYSRVARNLQDDRSLPREPRS